jgi:acetyl esterase/lipase
VTTMQSEDNSAVRNGAGICSGAFMRFLKGAVAGTSVAIACALIVSITGCGGSSTDSSEEDRIVAGVNLTELFRPPTQAEREEVLRDWSLRTHSAVAVTTVSQNAVSLGGSAATVRIVSHTVGDATHFGAIVSPDNAEPGSLPLIVYLHGGDDGVDVKELLSVLPIALGSLAGNYAYLVPSFRSEKLRYNGMTYTSTGDASPWDRDVDDVLSLIDVASSLVPAIDGERIGLVGFSRGACVAMLAGIRDKRIGLVIEFFGPTDFYSAWTEEIFADALDGTLRELPGVSILNRDIIQPLKSGTKTYADVRLDLLRRSPVYFVDQLPPTQGHHGMLDTVVPVSEAELLRAAFIDEGPPSTDHAVYTYPLGGHDAVTVLSGLERARGFLSRLSR